MQNRELNTCKHDIYSFLHVRLPTNTEPLRVRYFVLCIIFAVENPATRTVCCVFAKQTKTIRMEEHNILIPLPVSYTHLDVYKRQAHPRFVGYPL